MDCKINTMINEDNMDSPTKIKERIRTLFAWRNITYEEYARRVKAKYNKNISTSGLSHKLARETISFKEVIEISNELGYDVIFKPRNDWE